LVFDLDFYAKASARLAQSGLDDRYLPWLYKQCLLKEPRSLAGLFYKLFFAPNMAELFKVRRTPQAPPVSVKNVSCPVCGGEHNGLDEECPVCGLRKQDINDRGTIEKERRIFLLTPEKKAAFQQEYAALFENPFKDIPGTIKRQKELYRKYGIL
jgi:hypothetical protein